MSLLYVDEKTNVLDDPKIQKQNEITEKFEEYVKEYIETHYKGEDSEAVYALFNPQQVELLRNFFKGFSVEMYQELNGTVELQIQKRNEKVKQKIANIGEAMGMKIKLEDWVYDGMVDSGKNAGLKCDLCPRPVRYAHHAVNKKTHECLRFGCNCAADFFNMDKGTLASMRTIQANTLKDIKIIACIVEKKKLKEYYQYMCGYTGRVLLEVGPQGIRDLMVFKVQWDDNGKLVGDEHNDEYPVIFGDKSKSVKSLAWIKEHIISCLNADMSDNIYDGMDRRDIVKMTIKDMDKAQANNTVYINYALKFLDVGLPIPLSLVKKINSIIQKISKQHHPDYLKYVQELLMQKTLAKHSLLRTAFSDFIINYLASTMGTEKRDPEMELWGIRGQGTFYKTVLLWESVIAKLDRIKELEKMISDGFISESEFERFCKLPNNVSDYLSYSQAYKYTYKSMKPFISDCMDVFMNNKPVIKLESNFADGFSKYMLKGKDNKIILNVNKLKLSDLDSLFYVDKIPSNIHYCYIAYQNGYRQIVSKSLSYVRNLLKAIVSTSSNEDLAKLLVALKPDSHGNYIHSVYEYFSTYSYRQVDATTVKELLYREKISESLIEEVLKKYGKSFKLFKKDCNKLVETLDKIYKDVRSFKFKNFKVSEILNDYDEMLKAETKTPRDSFIEYTELLIGKRSNKSIQKYLNNCNLNDLTVFSDLEPYFDMLRDIQDLVVVQKKKDEEKDVYRVFNLERLNKLLKDVIDLNNSEKFMWLVVATWALSVNKLRYTNSRIIYSGSSSNVTYLIGYINDLLTDKGKEIYKDECLEFFDKLYSEIKGLHYSLTPALRYNTFLDLLDKDTTKIKKELNKVLGIKEFREIVKTEVDVEPFEFPYNYSYDILSVFDKMYNFKGFNDLSSKINQILFDVYEKYASEEDKKEEEMSVKKSLVDAIKPCLIEHIKFFEVDVNAVRYRYRNVPDETIRRKESFRIVQYQKAIDTLPAFVDELYRYGVENLSEGMSEFINKSKMAVSSNDIPEIKKMYDVLRTEMYNRKLIYNHFDITYKILKELSKCDLYWFDKLELHEIWQILKIYYLYKSGIDRIKEIMEEHNISFDFNYSEEIDKIPNPQIVDIKSFYETVADRPDETGLSGVQKAELLFNHSDFNNWSTFHQGVVKRVALYKRCSDKQLPYINELYDKVILGKSDNIVDSADCIDETKLEEYKGPNCLPYNEAKEAVLMAEKVKNHSNFDELPKKTQDIVETVYMNGKKGVARCSSAQYTFIKNAKIKLKID